LLLGLLLLMLLDLFSFESDGVGLHWQVLECVQPSPAVQDPLVRLQIQMDSLLRLYVGLLQVMTLYE
jgi:hypothetical protein